MIQAPGLTIGLHPAKKVLERNKDISIGFSVKDFDASAANLQAKGIVLEIKKDGWSKLAYFKDLDGTPLYLIEEKNK